MGHEDFLMQSMLDKHDATPQEVCDLMTSVLAAKCSGAYDEPPNDDLLLDLSLRLQEMLLCTEKKG